VLFSDPVTTPVDAQGDPYPGAKAHFYLAGTLTPATVYADAGLTTALSNPVVANASGQFVPIYLDPTVTYRRILRDASDVLLRDNDNINTASLTQASVGLVLFPRSANEIATSVTPSNYAYPVGDIRRYGAVSGDGNCATAFTNALLATNHVTVPVGDWRVDTTVEITENRTVRLEAGAVVTRYSAFSVATTPVFWLSWSQGALIGSGIGSQVKSQNRAPDGVVLIGFTSMTTSFGRDVLYCTVRDVLLRGSTNYGQTTGNPDACLKIINAQLDGKASYFHIISNVVFNAANYGLWLQGWANGLQMSNLHFYWIGNDTLASKAAIFSQGALDNACAGVFHHFSPNTPTIRIEDYDNTATSGGSLHVTSYSSYSNIVCEQDGASAYALVANATCTAFKNYIQIVDNVALAYSISNNFRDGNNLIFTSTGARFEDVQISDDLSVGDDASVAGTLTVAQVKDTTTAPTYGASVAINAALGNHFVIVVTDTSAFTIANPTNPTAGQMISLNIRNGSGGSMGAITWGGDFRLSAWTNPANGYSRSIQFRYYGTTWVEESRTAADVLN
jgi:hypothetical protein